MEPSAQPSPTATPVPPAMLPRLPLPRMGNAPTLREQGGDALALAGIAHDARNLVTALGLCAEMIGEPGVLAPHHSHFATEIRSITAASAHLVERISGLARTAAQAKQTPFAETPVTDLSEAVRQMGSLLSAVAGPVTELQIACLPCRGQLQLSEESLSRILVNLVRNAEAERVFSGRSTARQPESSPRSICGTMRRTHRPRCRARCCSRSRTTGPAFRRNSWSASSKPGLRPGREGGRGRNRSTMGWD